MKKIILLSIMLLFGWTMFAQNVNYDPRNPYVQARCEQFLCDQNELPPWASRNTAQMFPDCFPPSFYGMGKEIHPTPVVYIPKIRVVSCYSEPMKPDSPGWSPTVGPNTKRMHPY